MNLVKCIVYPSPNLFISAMAIMSGVSLANIGFSEIRVKHLKYSKFSNIVNGDNNKKIKISSREGMLIAYTPAFLAGLASFGLLPFQSFKLLLIQSLLTFHFFKRIFEVFFIHKYSGGVDLDTAIGISLSYLTGTAIMIYNQYITQANITIDLTYPGILLFAIGITVYSFAYCTGTTLYLIGRSYATRRWYLSKMDDFPKHVKALIPFVF